MFSGVIKEGSKTWLDFVTAMQLIPEINTMNQSDAQLMTRLEAPAKLCNSVCLHL